MRRFLTPANTDKVKVKNKISENENGVEVVPSGI